MVAYRSRVPDPETIEAVFKPTMLMVSNYIERTLLAQESERTKNDFFGLISHELRTPLTSIIGYTELLEEIEAESLSPRAQKFIEVIDRNARRELRLVQDLLLLVRLEGGSFTLEREATDLAALVEQSCEIVRPQAEARGVAVSRRPRADRRALDRPAADRAGGRQPAHERRQVQQRRLDRPRHARG